MSEKSIFGVPSISFHTKTALANFIRGITKRNEPGKHLEGVDHDVIEAVFRMHPDHHAKAKGRKIAHFEVRRYKFQTLTLFVIFDDGTFVDFSWKKALSSLVDG